MVYLTLQQNYGQRNSSYDKTTAVQKCGDFPYEIALRFANCVLRCGACFAAGYSWSDLFQKNRRVVSNIPLNRLIADYNSIPIPPDGCYNWMRILGGEPLLNDEYIEYLFDFIIDVSKSDSKKFHNGIIIQTNGIHIGKGNTEVLRKKLNDLYGVNSNVMISIETSIKGTNPAEFALLTQSSSELYQYNIRSYYNLMDLHLPNLRPVIIAGFGVNESYLLNEGNSNYRITILFKEDTPIYHPDNWDEHFSKLYSDFTQEYSKWDNLFARMPMYGIKDQFQYGWVKPAISRGKKAFGQRWYDSQYCNTRSLAVENKFSDILKKFFLRSNQVYYSKLIQP